MTDISTEMTADEQISVTVDKGVEIDTNIQLLYIKSGQKEIADYVENTAKPEITNYTNEYAKPIVTEIVNQTTKPLIDNYLSTTTKPQIDEYVADNVKPYADSAQESAEKAKISENNAKTSETNAKASELAAESSAGVASAAAVTANEAKDYTAKVLTDENLKTVGQDLQSADSNIKTVATNIVNVNINAKNIDNVNLLAPHTEAMEALAPDIMDVVTVAGIAEQTKNVSENMSAVVDTSNNKTNINNVSSNITAVNNVSENMADVKEAVQSANDAKLWAVGTKTEKPEGSSKYWAEQAQQAAQVYDATEMKKGIVRLATSEEVKAGTNDSAVITPLKLKQNLDAKQDILTAVNYNNITNCITKIPQDIKLELKDGTLTLKAGSKVYVPNGFESDGTTPKFDVITTTVDKTYSDSARSSGFVFCDLNGNLSIAGTYQIFYNKTENKCYFSGSAPLPQISFPIARFTADGKNITSIDIVFNGFGYLAGTAGTVFVLPGVEGLIPNGRNKDGSLKNTKFTTTSVLITTNGGSTDTRNIMLNSNNLQHPENSYYIDSKNINTSSDVGIGNQDDKTIIATCTFNMGKITSFSPKSVFQAVDRNELNNSDYVVESYKAGSYWYRVYKSGWIEQGGIFNVSENNTTINITYRKPFANTNYTLLGSFICDRTDNVLWSGHYGEAFLSISTTGFSRLAYPTKYMWYACGQGA